MELIEATIPADGAYAKVSDALRWLSEVPVPADIEIGSVGGRPARHRLFKDFEAPLLFSSKKAQEAYRTEYAVIFVLFPPTRSR